MECHMRPKSKDELLEKANSQFDDLWKLINGMSEEDRKQSFQFSEEFLAKKKEAHWRRDKDLKDVLIHLYEWHLLLLRWLESNFNGEERNFLPEPYNWRTYGKMNEEFVEKHQTTSLVEAENYLKKSHEQVMKKLDALSNEELFQKKQFAWVGNTTLGSYFISATASHYEWAIKKLKQSQKNR